MRTETPFVILTSDRADHSAEVNASKRDMLTRQLFVRDLDFMPVTGYYKGKPEQAYLVLLQAPGDQHLCEQLARHYGQESILHVDANRHAALFMLHEPNTGGPDVRDIIGAGTWREVPEAEATARDAYTVHDGRYFIAA